MVLMVRKHANILCFQDFGNLSFYILYTPRIRKNTIEINTNYLEKYSIFGRILQKSGKNTGETDADTKLVTNADAAAAGTAAVANAAAYASAADTNTDADDDDIADADAFDVAAVADDDADNATIADDATKTMETVF